MIYLDHQSTTPMDPRVLDAMLPFLREQYANASSRFHAAGLATRSALESAREQVAALLGAMPEEVIFTSGATESNNLAIQGVARAQKDRGKHLVSVTTEHKSVIDPLMALRAEGFEVTFLSVDRAGRLDLGRLNESLRPDTTLLSVMAANNEIGTIHPIAAMGELARANGTTFHCDATQAVGWLPLDVDAMNIDLLSMSAHKIAGPKGVGALYTRMRKPRVRLQPLVFGGGQEGNLRSGTYNHPGIVGFGAAAAIALADLGTRPARIAALRDRLWRELDAAIPNIRLNGPPLDRDRLPHNLNIAFTGCEAQSILMECGERIAASPGSACMLDNNEPSYVLLALGLSRDEAVASLRFSLGRTTTESDLDEVPGILQTAVGKLRGMIGDDV